MAPNKNSKELLTVLNKIETAKRDSSCILFLWSYSTCKVLSCNFQTIYLIAATKFERQIYVWGFKMYF